MKSLSYTTILILMFVLLLLTFLLALTIGRYEISFFQVLCILLGEHIISFFNIDKIWTNTMETVVFTLRIPRTLAAMLIGSALAISGAAYQSLFRNPMVSPSLLGVSSGAAIGAAIAIIFGYSNEIIQIFAFVCGILTVLLTLSISKLLRSNSIIILVLSGVVVQGLTNSIMGIIKYFADPETALAEIVYWTMGSVKHVTIQELYVIAPYMIIAIIIMLCIRYRFNVLALGEFEAKSVGINVKFTRLFIIALSTFLTAASVCLAGTIGWVGLVSRC